MFYETGVKTAFETLGMTKHAYGVLKNLGGAIREGVTYLTPTAKSTLLGGFGGAGVGGITGALSDSVPGGALGGALMGAGLGGAGGRLAPGLARRFSNNAAMRLFPEHGRLATRQELLKMLQGQAV